MSSIRDAFEQALGFFNAGDVEGLVNLYTEDATLVTPFGTFEGRAAIREARSREKPPSRTTPSPDATGGSALDRPALEGYTIGSG